MIGRKILGTSLVVLIGLPVLFGVIWAVGLVRASLSSDFLTKLPQEIIAEIPASMDGIFAAARDENLRMDPGARAWIQAAEKTGIRPSELLEKTGILGWMKGEVSRSLNQVGEVLRGETSIHSISIDMRPLKAALLHPEMDRFLEGLVDNLPPCDEQGMKIWQDRLSSGFGHGENLPACRPVEAAVAKQVLFGERGREVEKIEDSVEVMENVHPFPFERFGVTKAATMLSYLLFLLPALIILAGVWLANRTAGGRLRWAGISTLAGSLPVLLMAFVLKRFSSWALDGGWVFRHSRWTNDWDAVVFDKL
ncbi:MAG: hypothetical protein NTW38_04085, partial [Candidatus Aminicenantes bacterium]|nr:hypothetical protein [Candidatus Aminicenantes bacterium]